MLKFIRAAMALALTIAITLITLGAHAEYRAFELAIENTEKGTTRTVITTFDQLQYPKYHPVDKNEVVRYVDSWMCFENMSHFKPTCQKPETKSQ